jgi:hypothetical protein
VQERIREKQSELRFFNIFGNLSRQRHLATIIRRHCSSLRNAYREMVSPPSFVVDDVSSSYLKLRDSVIGANTVPLDDFACNVANRFAVSGRVALGRSAVAHIALLVSL